MKKILSTIISIIMLMNFQTFVFAENANSVCKISLEDAINRALTDNEQIIANEYRQKANKIAIDSAKITKNALKKTAVSISSGFESYCAKEGYYVDAAQTSYNLSVKEGEKIKTSIKYKVMEAYYNVILSEKLVNAAVNAYDFSKASVDAVTAQYELGLISRLDYEAAVLALESAKNALEAQKLNRQVAIDNLKSVINMDDGNFTLELTDEIEVADFTADVEADTTSALQSRYDIIAVSENQKLANQYFELSKVLTDNTSTYNNAYASLLEANSNYSSTKKQLTLYIKTLYNNITTSKANMDIAKKQYENELNKYIANKEKHSLGLISNNELTQSINSLYETQVSYANAKAGYRLAIEKYKCEIDTGL